jgi:serine/threonine protein kinase
MPPTLSLTFPPHPNQIPFHSDGLEFARGTIWAVVCFCAPHCILRAVSSSPQKKPLVTSGEQNHRDTSPGVDVEGLAVTQETGPAPNSNIIGHYQLLQRIGMGGMGEVWVAEQREPIRRRVAVKLIKAGMDSREVIARFESERQTLALMDHPAIAKVLDAGSTPQGAPYFVMDYVAGVPITAYCDQHRLSTHERLELFVHVCEGVQHAHQKAVIHRDLKPSNILVSEIDGRAAPKIIDFGVAKALTGRLTSETFFTTIGALVGTPEYMSPEQALSSGEDIDVRTDVYSLGIVLYELLTGVLPILLSNVTLSELLRRLKEEEPSRPSAKVQTQDPSKSTELARCRQADPMTLAKQLKGELDSIVLKAVDKDRSHRYASASDFAADIGRYLRNEGVLAVPYSTSYRVRKFVGRYRAPLGTLGAFILVLIAATAFSIRQSILANRQRDRADSQAAIAKAVNEFLQNDLLSQADSAAQGGNSAPDPEVKVRTLLDRAADRTEKRFANQPLVESEIQGTIGQTYLGLGLAAQGEEHLRRAYELSVANRGPDAPETLDMLTNLSEAISSQNRSADALAAAKTAFEGESRTLGPENPKTLVAMQNLGVMYLLDYQYADAEPLLKRALEIQTRHNGYDNIDTLNTSDGLAELYIEQSRYSEARPLLARGLESYRRVFGPEHPFTEREMFGLGKVLLGEGSYPEAENVFSDVLALEQRVRGKRHPDTLSTMNLLGSTYVEEGKFAAGVSLMEDGVRDRREVLGPRDRNTLKGELELGWAYHLKGDRAHAEQLLRSAMLGFRALGKDQGADLADAEDLLGFSLIEQHKYSEAEPLLREALAYRQQEMEDWHLSRTQTLLGAALNGLRRYPETEKLLLDGQQGLLGHESRMPAGQKRWLRFCEEQMVALYSAWGQPENAMRWQTKLQEK